MGHLSIAFHQPCLAEVSLHVVLIREPSLVSSKFARRELWHAIIRSLVAEVIALHFCKHSGLIGHSGL